MSNPANPVFAVIDTNVIVSALLARNPQSPTVLILERVFDGTISLVANEEILDEYLGVLLRPKFSFETSVVKEFVSSLSQLATRFDGVPYYGEMVDPNDRVFFEVALEADSYLVTGNLRHFPANPKVISPAQMMDLLTRK